MTWQAALILVGGLAAIAAGVAYLIHRAGARARDAEADLAVERSKTLDVQARELRQAAHDKLNSKSDAEVLAEADALAERIRQDMERRGGR